MSTQSNPGRVRQQSHDFRKQIDPHRHQLLRHCYRMLGSLTEAEDVLQEVLLRAWRGAPRFEGRAAFRTWLYRIATNACLTHLSKHPRRSIPELSTPVTGAGEGIAPATDSLYWIEPFPDRYLGDDVETLSSRKESVALAFVVALQRLAPRQRAVLLLRDVLGYEIQEVVSLLDMSIAAVNSALARARRGLAQDASGSAGVTDASALDPATQALLRSYVQAWESGDVSALVSLMRRDATFSMPPYPSWFRGRAAIRRVLSDHVFADGRRFRLRLTSANGAPAFTVYKAELQDHGFRAHGIQLPWLGKGLLDGVLTFLNPRLVRDFGFPHLLKNDRGRSKTEARRV